MAKQYAQPEIEIIEVDASDGNRYSLPYGIAKGLGLDTTGMRPREVWEMLKGHGYNPKNAYGKLKQKTSKVLPKGEIIQVKPIKNDYIRKIMQVNKVDYVPVRSLTQQLDEKEIIDKVGGIDKTKGSCASLALVYFGNKAGVDVADMRGGISMHTISPIATIKQIAQMDGVKSFIEEDYNDFVSAKKVLSNVKEGKEYYFGCGSHGAVVRRKNGELQYLELQKNKENGFKHLNSEVLRERFLAHKSHTFGYTKLKYPSILIDGETLQNSSDFVNLLPYINTKK